MTALTTILVPLDGSPPSIAALDHAVVLASDYGGRIDVLHVQPDDAFQVGSNMSSAPAARAELEREMSAAFARAEQRLGANVTRKIVTGDPLRKIIEHATDGEYDMIVIGTHGRVGRLHAILGSVAEGVVRSAPCPVLTVREPGGAYQSFAERIHGNPSLAEQAGERH